MTALTRGRRGRLETQTRRGRVTTEAEAEEAVTAQGRLQPQQLEEAGGTPAPPRASGGSGPAPPRSQTPAFTSRGPHSGRTSAAGDDFCDV